MNEKCWLKEHCNKIDCDRFCKKFFKVNFLYDMSLIPYNRRKHTNLYIDNDGSDEKEFEKLSSIESNILDFINNGDNLFLFSSNMGNGKTEWSLRLAERFISRIWATSDLTCRVLFISVPRFLLELKDNIANKSEYVEHIKKYVTTCDLVIWDDIATKLGTEFELSHLLSIIDNRMSNNKANIFTSNISPENLSSFLEPRLASRIANSSIQVMLQGADKRNLKYLLKK